MSTLFKMLILCSKIIRQKLLLLFDFIESCLNHTCTLIISVIFHSSHQRTLSI
ncbi:hypothetical protein Lalb_Chr12g0208041 [Lupinus albus]|uniref:Uncharacterized protein n=1 Tax=Lupinus albus TaxID=3870 RepID=A0A6A4PPM7_LUPAL|nr:hypothetical protein Lalb_Chr12g0208041 [Lupinus albus]